MVGRLLRVAGGQGKEGASLLGGCREGQRAGQAQEGARVAAEAAIEFYSPSRAAEPDMGLLNSAPVQKLAHI